MLIAVLCALALLLAAPARASANENFADEPPFGGELPPPLVHPPSLHRAPPGFRLSPTQVVRIADSAPAVRDERGQSPGMRPVVFERGADWQASYYTGTGGERTEVAEAIVDDQTGTILGAWHDQQLSAPLARGYSGAIAQNVNAPYVWLPLCVLFIVPFFDPRRPFRLLHLDLLMLLGLGVSLYFFNRAEIKASVALTYPVLLYVFCRMLWSGARPPERRGPLIPLVSIRWLVVGAVVLACARIALNVIDSHVIDVGVAGVIGADHITHGQDLYNGAFAPGVGIRGDVYGPFNYLAYVPFEAVFPWDGHWGGVPAAHAAAIAFDLLTALGLLALGRRLAPRPEGRVLGVALAFAWLAYPFTLYTMNANANDSLVAALLVGAMLVLASPPARGAMLALGAAAKFGPAALAPLFATGTGERRWRSAVVFAIAFVVVAALLVLPFLPDGGLREFYDRTLGYQASRSSPFSVWGLAPSLDFLRPVERVVALALALAVALWPRRKTPAQVAAFAAAVVIAVQLGATHWFYFYVVWFLPLVLVALFVGRRRGIFSGSGSRAAPGSAS
ncbi:MAG TPA: glycosyltransferase 87 family protein [Solirubrobacterales bacterium]|nr:glycosyltransferase 87 family protein [Solirubrobacterales bacterium]